MDLLRSSAPKAAPALAIAWWMTLLLRGILPAAFAIAMGALVGAVQRGSSLTNSLAIAGTIFVLLQVLSPIHQALSANLGDRTAAWLYDRLTEACVRPSGMRHLEDPRAHQRSHRRARLRPRHDRAATSIIDFVAGGMVGMSVSRPAILVRDSW